MATNDHGRWIAGALGRTEAERARKRGALHRMLRIPVTQRIPLPILTIAAEHPERFFASPALAKLLQRRARFALLLHRLRKTR